MKQLPYINKSEGIIGYSESVIAQLEKNDCFVRTVASSFDIPYDDAHFWVKEKFNRENRKGTLDVVDKMDSIFNNKGTLEGKTAKKIMELRKFDSVKMKMVRTTLNQFIKKYPTGTYIIIVRRHAFTLKNGSIIGNKQDATSMRKIVNFAYEIK